MDLPKKLNLDAEKGQTLRPAAEIEQVSDLQSPDVESGKIRKRTVLSKKVFTPTENNPLKVFIDSENFL